MTQLPLVTVICICHNHEDYVQFALDSVVTQTYTRIQLIIVDDGSKDGSKERILDFIEKNGNHQFINNSNPVGNCKAFNSAFAFAKGEFIIDLAADDMLLAKRVEEGINGFLNVPENVGVQFSDAFLINATGEIYQTFYQRGASGSITNPPPEGFIFQNLISRYFICPPTMMIKREVLEQLNGYDESLTYEDFDFWIRSSRNWQYLFHRAPLVKKRELKNSLGKQQTIWKNKHAGSTYKVCQKTLELCDSKAEIKALRKRIIYELRKSFFIGHLTLIQKYFALLIKTYR